MMSLIPMEKTSDRMLDFSIPCSVEARDEAYHEIRQFMKSMHLSDTVLTDHICLCTEELLDNIVVYSGMTERHLIDIRIVCQSETVMVMTKDDGAVFDPVSYGVEKRGLGMTLIHSLCQKYEYRYMYGQNMSFMTWSIPHTEKTDI